MKAQAAPAVSMKAICKAFSKVTVLDQVDFEVRAGEVHALAGGNGAGKSTLMKILQGVYSADAGQIEVFGQPLQAASIHQAKQAGIGMVFQEFSLVETLSVAQNIYLDAEPVRWGVVDDAAMRRGAANILQRMGVPVDPTREVSTLPTAAWQLTEIAKALSQQARVLIMDEPTAALSKTEVAALFDLIKRLKAQGIAIIYISHRMDEVHQIADRITILQGGKNYLTAEVGQLTPSQIVAGIAGRELAAHAEACQTEPIEPGEVLLAAEDLTAPGVGPVSFELRAGQVLGLVGLMGSGRTELARALFGTAPATGGRLFLRGKPVKLGSPQDAIKAGIALIPEDRRWQGLMLDHSVSDNLTLPVLGCLKNGLLLSKSKVTQEASRLINLLSIRVTDPASPAKLLSGGNQQKIVIAKWLATNPDVLVMDEPTAGVDIATKTEIAAIVRNLAHQGKGIIMISSELAELVGICDEFIVLRDGAVATTLAGCEVQSELDLELAAQGMAA
jgi:ribose transport system ATP-binding protein